MKKIIAMLVALMMLALPMAGLAENAFGVDYYTQAIESGRRVTTNMYVENIAADFTGDEAVDQIITDLLSAVSITTYSQDNEEFFALGLKQEQTGKVADLLTLGFAQDDDVNVITSNLLGGAIAVSAEEAPILMERLIDVLAMIGLFTEEDAQMLKDELATVIAAAPSEAAMEDEIMAMIEGIDFTALDFSALTDAFLPVLESVETAEVTMQPKNCDPAVNMVPLNITGEQMKTMMTSFFRFIKANPQLAEVSGYFYDMMLSSAVAMAEEEIPTYTEMLDKMLAEMDEEINIEGDTTVTVYLGEDGMPVMAEVKFPEQEANDAAAVAETVSHTYVPTITYTRLTMNEVAAHSIVMDIDNVDMTLNLAIRGENITVSFAVAEDGMTMFQMNMEIIDRSAENLIAFDMDMNMTIVDDEQYDIAYNEETQRYEMVQLDPVTIEFGMKIVSDTVLNGIDFTSREAITISVAGKDYCTIVAESASAQPGASIADGEVVRPAALTDADFANWFVGVINGLQTWLYTVIEALPASILNLMMTM